MLALRALAPRLAAPAAQARLYTTQLSAAAADLPYRVRRNSHGAVPVYTDIRNGGTRYLVQIRNVEGNVDVRAPVSCTFRPRVLTSPVRFPVSCSCVLFPCVTT